MKKLIPVALILVLGTFLRFYHIGEKSLWLDEASSLYRAQNQFLPMLKEIADNDAHPPLYNTLLHFWIRGGKKVAYPQSFSPQVITEARTRSLSALLGVLTILMIYQLGRLFFGEKVGLLASLIMAASSHQVFYAQEARLQTTIILLTLLSLYFFYRSLGEKKKSLWLGFILSTALSLYTFFYSFFILLGENLFFLSRFKRYRSSLKTLIASQLIIFLLFSLWIPVLIQRIDMVKSLPSSPNFSLLASFLNIRLLFLDFTFGYPRFAFPDWLSSLTLLLFLSLAIYGWIGLTRRQAASLPATSATACASAHADRSQPAALLLLFWLLLPIFMALSFPLRIHIFQSKHLIFAAPAYYLLLSRGLVKLKSRKVGAALLMLFILLNLASLRLYYLEGFIKEDWRTAANYVEENSRPRDLILFDPPYIGFAFDYYCSGSLDRVGVFKKSFPGTISALRDNYARVWLIRNYSPVSRPSGAAGAWLKEKYLLLDSEGFPGLNGHIVVNLHTEKTK